MATRTWIVLFTIAGAVAAGSARDLAAFYVALVGGAIVYLLHAIEFKINRLLDQQRIRVPDRDIAKDH